jgi:hypothetical protein
MARHVDVLGHRRCARHEREASVSRTVELLAGAVAVLAGPMLHSSTPALPVRRRRRQFSA